MLSECLVPFFGDNNACDDAEHHYDREAKATRERDARLALYERVYWRHCDERRENE